MVNEQTVSLIIALSFVVKVVVDLIKLWTQYLKLPENFHRYTSITVSVILGVLLAYETNTGILGALGLAVKHAWVEITITGFLIAAGSDVIYELLNYVRTARVNNKTPG
jgi:hypothetical protein